jgi:hypothetical protein
MRYFALSVVTFPATLILAGCVAQVEPPRVEVVARPAVAYVPAPPRAVVSVYVEPPLSQPEPIAVGWAPPPLLVESPPPPPFAEAVWVGGYWVWQGDWVWAHGHWVGAPRPNYAWVHPYYEHRDGVVLFITGHWSPPGVAFVPPPPGIHLTVEIAAAGVIAGPRPMGPNGCFIPPPPGSRPGIIIPAPIGTAPAVMTGAPPVVAVGMRVTNTVNNNVHNTTVINNTTNNVTNVRNVTNITNVTIVAPATATANGRAVNTSAPAQAHLAAAQSAVVEAAAPEPASSKPIPAFVHGRPPAPLPPSQAVSTAASEAKEAHTNSPRPDNQGRAASAGKSAPEAQPAAGHPAQSQGESRQVAAGQHPAAGDSKGKSGGDVGLADHSNNNASKPESAKQGSGAVPVDRQVAAASGRGRPTESAKHAVNTEAVEPGKRAENAKLPAKGKEPPDKSKDAQTAAKNKSDHAKKSNGKDEKREHDEPG